VYYCLFYEVNSPSERNSNINVFNGKPVVYRYAVKPLHNDIQPVYRTRYVSRLYIINIQSEETLYGYRHDGNKKSLPHPPLPFYAIGW